MPDYDKENVRSQIEHFETADKYKTKAQVGNALENTRRLIGVLDVICPYCNYPQRTENFVSRKCLACGRKFVLFPEHDLSRLAMTTWNKQRMHLIHQYYHLKKTGRFLI